MMPACGVCGQTLRMAAAAASIWSNSSSIELYSYCGGYF
jgi:hypothetical protein